MRGDRKSPVVLFPSSRSGRLREAAHRDDGGHHPPTSADLVRARCPPSRPPPNKGEDDIQLEEAGRVSTQRLPTTSSRRQGVRALRGARGGAALGVLSLDDPVSGARTTTASSAALSRSSDARASSPRTPPSALAFAFPPAPSREFAPRPPSTLCLRPHLKMLRALHTHLSEHRTVTQRGLFSRHLNKTLFPPRAAVNRCLTRDVGLLRCARRALGGPPPARTGPGSLRSEAPRDAGATSLPGTGHLDVPGNIAAVEDPAVEFRSQHEYSSSRKTPSSPNSPTTGVGSSRDGARDRQS